MSEVYKQKLNHGEFITTNSPPTPTPYRTKQEHTNIVVPIQGQQQDYENIVADGSYYLSSEKLDTLPSLCVLTADCLPVAVEGKNGYSIIHAGWRGLASNILKDPALAKLEPQTAIIGPSIHVCCYEVDLSLQQNFDSSFFARHNLNNQKLMLNLQAVASYHLKEAYPGIHIIQSELCTFCHEKFHSYRRNKTTERNWNTYRPFPGHFQSF